MSPRRFPEGFLWGTATSAFQVEMGRGEPSPHSDWYAWVHDEGNIASGRVSGDLPEDGPGSWELYGGDLRLARDELGNNAIRLSLDWSRIFPRSTRAVEVDIDHDDHGNVSRVNVDEDSMRSLRAAADGGAVRRYRQILSEARELGLTVMLTLYHWPIPLWLHDPIACRDDVEAASLRGWLDQRTVIEFAKYAAFAADALGDLVDLYATINEPRIVSEHGYLSERGEFPPGLNDPGLFLTSMRNLSIAHGVAYEQVKRWDRCSASDLGPASVGVVVVLQYYEPEDPMDDLDAAASDFVEYLYNEWYLNSILRGDYDMNLDGVIQPEEQWPHMVKGCDFIGVNYYSRWRVRYAEKGPDPRFNYDFAPCVGDCSDFGWEIYPPGLRHVLNWAYKGTRRPIYVTENGVADAGDLMRERYLVDHLEQIHAAMEEDGVPVGGYFHWSLIDNYEWSDGFRMRFGLFKVDMETKERRPTKAASPYREIAANNGLPERDRVEG
ncbi:MAG: family 1 glycosylhydrolase [Candidatus Bathyarchaeia archaeon]